MDECKRCGFLGHLAPCEGCGKIVCAQRCDLLQGDGKKARCEDCFFTCGNDYSCNQILDKSEARDWYGISLCEHCVKTVPYHLKCEKPDPLFWVDRKENLGVFCECDHDCFKCGEKAISQCCRCHRKICASKTCDLQEGRGVKDEQGWVSYGKCLECFSMCSQGKECKFGSRGFAIIPNDHCVTVDGVIFCTTCLEDKHTCKICHCPINGYQQYFPHRVVNVCFHEPRSIECHGCKETASDGRFLWGLCNHHVCAQCIRMHSLRYKDEPCHFCAKNAKVG